MSSAYRFRAASRASQPKLGSSRRRSKRTIAYLVDNRDAGVPHNVVLTTLEGGSNAPEPGEEIVASDVVTGLVEDYFASLLLLRHSSDHDDRRRDSRHR